MTRSELREENRRGSKAWELWSTGDRYDEPHYIATYSDKGEAERHMRRLKKSHPYVHYTLKHKKVAHRHLMSTSRRTRKGRARAHKRFGW
jgi:hypothetical protein